MTLVYGQIPRYSRPDRSWPKYSILGSIASPVPPGPILGFTALGAGGGGHGTHSTTFLVNRNQAINDALHEFETSDLLSVLYAWLFVTSGMPWMASIPEKKQTSLIEDDLIPLLSMFLEVMQNE